MHIIILSFISSQNIKISRAEDLFFNIELVSMENFKNKKYTIQATQIVDKKSNIDLEKNTTTEFVIADTPSETYTQPLSSGKVELVDTSSNIESPNGIDIPYVKHIYSKIEKVKYYPDDAKKNGITGKVKVSFVIRNDGELKDVKLISTSGNTLLDNAAIITVKNAAPFKRFTESVKEILFNLPIVYRLGD